MNLFNLLDLDISSILLLILNETSRLSSLKIDQSVLISLFDNNELCYYFNKIIQKLDTSQHTFNTFNDSSDRLLFEENISKLNILFKIKSGRPSCIGIYPTELYICG